MYRYVALRKRILGVDELHYYDVYAPLTKGVSAHYTYDQAKQMVLDAVAPLGEEYGTIVRKGFAERWIDVFPNKGKSGGAYSGGSYDSNPYIMCNFTGTLDSVSTIAHEMGHSMHSWFSRHTQPASMPTIPCLSQRSPPPSTRTCSLSTCWQKRTRIPQPAWPC